MGHGLAPCKTKELLKPIKIYITSTYQAIDAKKI